MPASTAFAHGWWYGNFKRTFSAIFATLTSETTANTSPPAAPLPASPRQGFGADRSKAYSL